MHAHASGDEDRAAELLQRVGLGAYRVGRIATLRRWLDMLGDDAIARNAGLALMAAWIAALGGDPVAAERWADAADDVRIDGPSLHGTASLRSSEAIVRAIMSRTGRDVPRGGGCRPGDKALPGGGVRPPRSRDDDPRGR